MSLFDSFQKHLQACTCGVFALLTATGVHAQQAAKPVEPAAQAATEKPATEKSGPAKAAKAPKRKATKDEAAQAEAPAAATKKDPAEAVRQVDGGIRLLQANKAEQAVQTLSVAIASGALPPNQMARALHNRGAAYRKAGKPAQAISDLTSSLWLKNGLSEADRQDAVKQRSEAYREAGLPDQTGEDGRPAGAATAKRAATASASGGNVSAGAPVATASLAPGQAAPATPSTSGLFQTLFGGLGKSQATAAQPAPVAAAVPVPSAVHVQPTTSAWSSASVRPAKTQPAAPTDAAVAAAPIAKPAPVKTASVATAGTAAIAAPGTVAAAQSGIHARIALVRNEAEAQPILQKLQSQHAAALGGKAASMSQAQFGGMGSFVQVRVGPYANMAEAQAMCGRLKGSGLDCVAVDR